MKKNLIIKRESLIFKIFTIYELLQKEKIIRKGITKEYLLKSYYYMLMKWEEEHGVRSVSYY